MELAALEQVRGDHKAQVEPSGLKAAAQGPSEPGLTAASGSSALSPISQLGRPLPTPTGPRGPWRVKAKSPEEAGRVSKAWRGGQDISCCPCVSPGCRDVVVPADGTVKAMGMNQGGSQSTMAGFLLGLRDFIFNIFY